MVDAVEMRRIVEGLPTKSSKIRALDAAGCKRADIARFLDIRYQHVRNVLVQGPPKSEAHKPARPPGPVCWDGRGACARGLWERRSAG